MKKIFLLFTCFLIVILLIIGLYRNHSDNHVEYNPFDDIREIDLMYDSFSLDEFPDKVKDDHYNFVEEFRDLLGSEYDIDYKNIQNIKYEGYRITYLFVDISSKKIVSKVFLYYNNSESIKRVKVEYRDIENEKFLYLYESLINMNFFDFDISLKNELNSKMSNNIVNDWTLGTAFSYEFFLDNKLRIINMYF